MSIKYSCAKVLMTRISADLSPIPTVLISLLFLRFLILHKFSPSFFMERSLGLRDHVTPSYHLPQWSPAPKAPKQHLPSVTEHDENVADFSPRCAFPRYATPKGLALVVIVVHFVGSLWTPKATPMTSEHQTLGRTDVLARCHSLCEVT